MIFDSRGPRGHPRGQEIGQGLRGAGKTQVGVILPVIGVRRVAVLAAPDLVGRIGIAAKEGDVPRHHRGIDPPGRARLALLEPMGLKQAIAITRGGDLGLQTWVIATFRQPEPGGSLARQAGKGLPPDPDLGADGARMRT